jgi:hypothetical protein
MRTRTGSITAGARERDVEESSGAAHEMKSSLAQKSEVVQRAAGRAMARANVAIGT